MNEKLKTWVKRNWFPCILYALLVFLVVALWSINYHPIFNHDWFGPSGLETQTNNFWFTMFAESIIVLVAFVAGHIFIGMRQKRHRAPVYKGAFEDACSIYNKVYDLVYGFMAQEGMTQKGSREMLCNYYDDLKEEDAAEIIRAFRDTVLNRGVRIDRKLIQNIDDIYSEVENYLQRFGAFLISSETEQEGSDLLNNFNELRRFFKALKGLVESFHPDEDGKICLKISEDSGSKNFAIGDDRPDVDDVDLAIFRKERMEHICDVLKSFRKNVSKKEKEIEDVKFHTVGKMIKNLQETSFDSTEDKKDLTDNIFVWAALFNMRKRLGKGVCWHFWRLYWDHTHRHRTDRHRVDEDRADKVLEFINFNKKTADENKKTADEEAVRVFNEMIKSEASIEGDFYRGLTYWFGPFDREDERRTDYGKAIEHFEKAAKGGHPKAQYYSGIAKIYGYKKDGTYQEAWKSLQEAEKKRDADAFNELGILYMHAVAVPRDEKKAAEYFHKAAEQGHPHAQNNLGIMYSEGWGVEQSGATAVEYFREAWNNGNKDAGINLGVMYLGKPDLASGNTTEEPAKLLQVKKPNARADYYCWRVYDQDDRKFRAGELGSTLTGSSWHGDYHDYQEWRNEGYLDYIEHPYGYSPDAAWYEVFEDLMHRKYVLEIELKKDLPTGKNRALKLSETESWLNDVFEEFRGIANECKDERNHPAWWPRRDYYRSRHVQQFIRSTLSEFLHSCRMMKPAMDPYGRALSLLFTDDIQEAEERFNKMAAAGSERELYNRIQYWLGLIYLRRGPQQDIGEARRCLGIAADSGISDAQYQVGLMSHRGQGGQKDPIEAEREAKRRFQQATELRHPLATYQLGLMYFDDHGSVRQNDSEALKLFKDVIENSNPLEDYARLGSIYVKNSLSRYLSQEEDEEHDAKEDAKSKLGYSTEDTDDYGYYPDGYGSTEDHVADEMKLHQIRLSIEGADYNEIDYLKDAIEKESYLGLEEKMERWMRFHGNSLPWNRLSRLKGLCTEEKTGGGAAVYQYCRALLSLFAGDQEDGDRFEEAEECFKNVAAGSERELYNRTQYWLGIINLRRGAQQDLVEARRYLGIAADSGISDAQYQVGLMYHRGQGGQKDPSEAERWFLRATKLGHPLATYQLGLMYFDGHGSVQQNYSEAKKLFKKVIENSDPLEDYAKLGSRDLRAPSSKDYVVDSHFISPAEVDAGNARTDAANKLEFELPMSKHLDEDDYLGLEELFYDSRNRLKDLCRMEKLHVKEKADGGAAVYQYCCALLSLFAGDQEVEERLNEAEDRFEQAAASSEEEFYKRIQYWLGIINLRRGAQQDLVEARRCLGIAADSGISDAQYQVGLMYHRGQGGQKDPAEAERWFLRATKLGHPLATYQLGLMYFDGHGSVQQNYSEAKKLFKKVIENSNPLEAYARLGSMCVADSLTEHPSQEEKAKDDATDQLESLKELLEFQSLMSKHLEGENYSGLEEHLYECRSRLKNLWRRVTPYVEEKADEGAARYQYCRALFSLFAGGQEAEWRFKEAEKWLKIATKSSKEKGDNKEAAAGSEREDNRIQYWLGLIYLRRGPQQDLVEARRCLGIAAHSGISDAQYQVGLMYHRGQGEQKDPSEAESWFLRATKLGHPLATYQLGLMYFDGHGSEQQNYSKAKECFEKVAKSSPTPGFSPSELGPFCLMDDRGEEMYKDAFRRNHLDALAHLGFIYMRGDDTHGVKQCDEKAIQRFEEAAEAGHIDAMFNLGLIYLKKDGSDCCRTEAIEWFEKAWEGNVECDERGSCGRRKCMFDEIEKILSAERERDEIHAKIGQRSMERQLSGRISTTDEERLEMERDAKRLDVLNKVQPEKALEKVFEFVEEKKLTLPFENGPGADHWMKRNQKMAEIMYGNEQNIPKDDDWWPRYRGNWVALRFLENLYPPGSAREKRCREKFEMTGFTMPPVPNLSKSSGETNASSG